MGWYSQEQYQTKAPTIGQFAENDAGIVAIQSIITKLAEAQRILDESISASAPVMAYGELLVEMQPKIDKLVQDFSDVSGVAEAYTQIRDVYVPLTENNVTQSAAAATRAEVAVKDAQKIRDDFNVEAQSVITNAKALSSLDIMKPRYLGVINAAATLDPNLYSLFTVTVGGLNLPLTISKVVDETYAVRVNVALRVNKVGNNVTWPSSVRFEDGKGGDIGTLAVGKVAMFELMTFDAGKTWLAHNRGVFTSPA